MPHNSITGEEALFGRDTTTNIVAIEPDYSEGVWVYRREGECRGVYANMVEALRRTQSRQQAEGQQR